MTSKKYVDLEALNFRTAPKNNPASRVLDTLHLGQPVEEVGPSAASPDWLDIIAKVNGVDTPGVVKAQINGIEALREPVSAAREALIAQAIKEWLRFDKGEGQEDESPYFQYVGEMWEAIGIHLNGKNRDQPWSAAAVSFMVRHAAGPTGTDFPNYLNFKFAAAHSTYMHDSIAQRRKNNTKAPFWGFERDKMAPQIGDIVGKWREAPSSFADAEAGKDFSSHCDIIVSVQDDFVLAIGGNVNQSVNITSYARDSDGFIGKNKTFNRKTGKQTGEVIIHMVNQVP